MNIELLEKLEKLNEIKLTPEEREQTLNFFSNRQTQFSSIETVDTEKVERMVHVMPIAAILREDVSEKVFTREQLQKDAPQTSDGYWQVPRLVE